MKTKRVIHPGAFIKEELEEREWSQRDLAFIIGCPEQSITAIVKGKRGITPEMAKSLAAAFDVSPELFTNLQQAYDLAKAKEPEQGVITRSKIQSHYPAREMIKRGWLSPTNDPSLLEAQLANFFAVDNFEKVPHLAHAAKKTYYDSIPPAQLAWLFRVKQLAQTIQVNKYNETLLRESIPKLHQLLITPTQISSIPQILAECGVRFLIVESIADAKIDGVCLWLDADSPVISMSVRFDRIDNFWFVLRHEIEHILQKDGKGKEIIDTELEKTDKSFAPEEKRANAAAANFLVPSKELDQFIGQTKPYYSEAKIITFSEKIKTHPGIVIGQLQNRGEMPYSSLRKYLVRVRDIISKSVLTDGWGQVAVII
jgi:HTH-type transcriptional regulator/antitoxin HigA